MWEFDRQDDSLLQRLLCSLKTRDVFPPDVGLLCQDSARECTAELLRIRVLFAVVLVPAAAS